MGECLAEQREAVPDLKNELVEVQKMLSHKRLLVEKLEDANEEFNIELNKLKLEDKIKKNFIANTDEKELVNLRLQLKETLEKLSESRIEFETLQSEKSNFEKELRIYQSKIEDMENKILNLEKNLVHNKEVEFKQISAELKEAKSEVMILFKEKNSLQEKCNELNDEITILQKGRILFFIH